MSHKLGANASVKNTIDVLRTEVYLLELSDSTVAYVEAYYLGKSEYEDIDGSNIFFDCYSELVFHITEGFRLVLETASFIAIFRTSRSNDAKKQMVYSVYSLH